MSSELRGSQAEQFVPPGGVIGIVGGGQLGRMLALAAARIGLDVHIYAPEQDCPASRVAAKTWSAAYEDADALADFARACDVVTFEFENIPVSALRQIEAAGTPVRPGEAALENSQDRLVEKRFLKSIGLNTAEFRQVDGPAHLETALSHLGEGFLKTRRAGYDGKGQIHLVPGDDAAEAWARLGGVPAIFEQRVAFARELSSVVARGLDGTLKTYDIPENTHETGVLRQSRVPADASPAVLSDARDAGERLADALDYVGVLALELFETDDGALLANEFAPRVHNTGHWTEDACITGQFEQHTRAVCGWPLASTHRLCDAVMENLLGDEVSTSLERANKRSVTRLYGKREIAPGRKMGHLTHLKHPRASA
ncbi:MAG: 5-(carboxyamino)imidazole ribonucleotide synthase [Pseudomonadota bacterium]